MDAVGWRQRHQQQQLLHGAVPEPNFVTAVLGGITGVLAAPAR